MTYIKHYSRDHSVFIQAMFIDEVQYRFVNKYAN